MGDPFEAIVGARHVLRSDADTLCGARVAAVVRPASGAELAECLRAASESGIAVVPVGGGTHLGLGNPLAAPVCVRLELGRIARTCELDAKEGIVELDAGVTLEALERAAAVAGKTTTLAPLRAGSTVGGAIAVDPVTPESSPDARLRNDLLGLEVALANGSLTRCGGRVVKNVTGFDLTRLYCGSFGALGVVTRAVLRLRAAPEQIVVTRAEFASTEAALEAWGRFASGARGLAAAVTPSESGAALWLRFAASAAEIEAERAHAPGEVAEPAGWSALRAELALPPAAPRVRIQLGGRPSDLALVCRGLTATAGAGALRLALPRLGIVFGLVGRESLADLAELARRSGAVLALERGDGAPPPCDAFGGLPSGFEQMRELKKRFDPQRVLSPGRFVGGL
ncbi:MAG TPA: FAD-binding oxidoreductase [Myxococcota bacterium]|nr:FAD-binding oxidoreductase [Myxococcota bacterium]